jgi:hypothetical protein
VQGGERSSPQHDTARKTVRAAPGYYINHENYNHLFNKKNQKLIAYKTNIGIPGHLWTGNEQ